MIKITGWKSKALWSKIGISEDSHDKRIHAFNVSCMLKRDYLDTSCEIRGKLIDSWIEPILKVTTDHEKISKKQ